MTIRSLISWFDNDSHSRNFSAINLTSFDCSNLRLINTIRVSIWVSLLLTIQFLHGNVHILIRDRNSVTNRRVTHLLMLKNVANTTWIITPVGSFQPVSVIILWFTITIEDFISVSNVNCNRV